MELHLQEIVLRLEIFIPISHYELPSHDSLLLPVDVSNRN